MRPSLTDPRTVVYGLAHLLLIAIGFLCINLSFPLSKEVGASLVAAGITGMVVFVYVSVSERRSQLVGLLREFGFVAAFEARASKIRGEYDSRLASASDSIDIMGFGLSAMRQDYQGDFASWAARATVRILLLDPTHPSAELSNASQRDLEESERAGTIAGQVQDFVHATRDLVRQDSRFQIRLYTCLPSINIFRVDDELFWGPYLVKQYSRNTPTFIVKRGGVLFRRIVEHFDAVWNDNTLSRPVPAEWLEAE